MTKPRPVTGLSPDRRLRPNARRILAVRIEEIWDYDRAVRDPANVTELHDMRIGFKRLRYLLEMFSVAFTADLDPFLEEVKEMQDILGDIHDCDVQVPLLEEHLGWLEAQEGAAVQGLVSRASRRAESQGVAANPEMAFRRFRARLDDARRARERPGILALIARRRADRNELYALFRREWDRLRDERFRERLEAAIGI